MGVKCLIGASQAGTSTANTTQYWPLAGSTETPVTVEANAQFVIRTGGYTATNLWIKVTANSVAATSTFRTRKNLANGNLEVSVGSNATGNFEDTTHSDTLASGDDYCLQTVPGAATGTYTIRSLSLLMESDQTDIQQPCWSNVGAATIGAASSTRFIDISGHSTNTTTEANHQTKIKKAGTFKNLAIYVSANPRTTVTTFSGRKNGVTTTMSVGITASTTGWFEEQVDTEAAAVDSLFCLVLVTGSGSSTMTYHAAGVYFTNANNDGIQLLSRGSTPTAQNANVTAYYPLVGRLGSDSTEANAQVKTNLAYTYSNLSLFVASNSVTAATTIRLRKNSTDCNQTASVGSSATGQFTDTSNTDTIAASDLLNYRIVTGATGTSITMHLMGVWALSPSGVAVTRTVPTETITVDGGTLARLSAKIRARADTAIIIAETRARLAAKNRPIATQVIIIGAGTAARVKGKVKSLATETITIGGGTLARLLAKIRTGSDTIAISENRARLAVKNRPLATQTITVGAGTIAEIKGAIRALATQTVTVTGGTIARLSSKIRALSAQTVAISEDLQRTVSAGVQNIVRTMATQTVTLSESIARLKASQRTITPPQTIVISAGTIARLTVKIRALATQTTAIAENRNRLKASMRTLATQTILLTDNRARLKGAVKTISQTITLTENRVRLATKLRALSLQTITIVDNAARQIIGGPQEIIRTLTQTVVLSEIVSRRLAVQRILTQTVPKAESLARVRGVLKSLLQTILVSESRSRIKSTFRTLSQTVVSSDSIAKRMTKIRAISQTILLASSVAQETVGNLVRSLVETVTSSDSIAKRMTKQRILTQTVTLPHQLNRLSTKLRTIPAQTITLSDSVISELNVIIKHAIRTLAQAITITEYAKIEVIKKSQRFRKILDPSIKRLKSNHPAWFLGSRGMHDHYEEFSP